MSRDIFAHILWYLHDNIHSILYINFSWIWDIFLHKDINFFFWTFIKLFQNTNIHVLIPTKWQSITDKHLKMLKAMATNWIKLNISVWLYSLYEDKYNELSGSKTFKKTMGFLARLRYFEIPFSLEFLGDETELKNFQKVSKKLWSGFSYQGYHNFSWLLWWQGDENYYNQCSFSEKDDYQFNDIFCPFLPLISKDGKLYSCSIWWKQKKFYYWDIVDIFTQYPDYMDIVYMIKDDLLLNSSKCKECTIYKIAQNKSIKLW